MKATRRKENEGAPRNDAQPSNSSSKVLSPNLLRVAQHAGKFEETAALGFGDRVV